MIVKFEPDGYTSCEYHEAWLSKNGKDRLVEVKLPHYTWKKSFEKYAAQRGFCVCWRLSLSPRLQAWAQSFTNHLRI